jgi:protein SDA1
LSKFQLIEIVVLFLRASSSSQLQRDHFSNLLRVYLLSPSENTQYFCQLIAFLSNVAHHYRHELGGYEQKVLSLLEERNASLDPKLRLTLIKAVIQMRVHDVLLPHATLPLFFRLLGTQDKTVREVVQKHIMTDLRGINTGRRNEKTNKLLQNFLFTLLRESDEMTSACATEVVVHLYNQHIWTGAKTVNVLATAALSPSAKVASRALRFFLSDDKAANETEEERAKKIEELSERYDDTHRLNNNYSKKTRNRVAKLEARMQQIARKRERMIADDTVLNVNFPAIQLIDDAQGFAERMLQTLRKVRETLDIRVLRMNLISRVIALHEVFLDGFYSHLIKYIQPHQQRKSCQACGVCKLILTPHIVA